MRWAVLFLCLCAALAGVRTAQAQIEDEPDHPENLQILPTDAARGDPVEGRKVARLHCTRCHVVGDLNPMGGIGSTPSFQFLAKREDYAERFSTFYVRRPHPVFTRIDGIDPWTDQPSHVATFEITPQQVDDILAYVETLRP
jgi:mono/diheme cytochrome c family protein